MPWCSHVSKCWERWILENDFSEAYFDENWEMVEDQIGQAGLRLAAWMNAIAAVTLRRGEDI